VLKARGGLGMDGLAFLLKFASKTAK